MYSITHNDDFTNDDSLQQALGYSALGWRVFPIHSWHDGKCTCDNDNCRDPAKHPINSNGCLGATTDPETIKAWFEETKGMCNWGIATGGGIYVLDVDPRHDGMISLARLQVDNECALMPITPKANTGSDGTHYYFALPEGVTLKNRKGFRPGLDGRGDGGYVVAPPSLHRSGKRYNWATAPDIPLAPMPKWLFELLSDNVVSPNAPVAGNLVSDKPSTIGEGPVTLLTVQGDLTNSPGVSSKRHDTLWRLIGIHYARGEKVETVGRLAMDWAKKCEPPLSPSDVCKAVQGIWKKHESKREHAQSPQPSNDASASDVGVGVGREIINSAEGEIINSLPEFAPQGEAKDKENSYTLGDEEKGISNSDTLPVYETYTKPEGEDELINSLPDAQAEEQAQGGDYNNGDCCRVSAISPDAYYGLLGAIAKAIEPETEADPVGVLVSLLTSFGSAVGSNSYFAVGPDKLTSLPCL